MQTSIRINNIFRQIISHLELLYLAIQEKQQQTKQHKRNQLNELHRDFLSKINVRKSFAVISGVKQKLSTLVASFWHTTYYTRYDNIIKHILSFDLICMKHGNSTMITKLPKLCIFVLTSNNITYHRLHKWLQPSYVFL